MDCRSNHNCAAPRRPRPWESKVQEDEQDTSCWDDPSYEGLSGVPEEPRFVSDGSDLILFLSDNAVRIRWLSRLATVPPSSTLSTSTYKVSLSKFSGSLTVRDGKGEDDDDLSSRIPQGYHPYDESAAQSVLCPLTLDGGRIEDAIIIKKTSKVLDTKKQGTARGDLSLIHI